VNGALVTEGCEPPVTVVRDAWSCAVPGATGQKATGVPVVVLTVDPGAVELHNGPFHCTPVESVETTLPKSAI
jgi:hypothetical protein